MRTLTLHVCYEPSLLRLFVAKELRKRRTSSNCVYFGGLRGAEWIMGAYIHGGWLMEEPSYLRREFKVE